GPARPGPGRYPAAAARPSRPGSVVQRYTEAGDSAGTLESVNGIYKVIPGEATVWVLDTVQPASGVLLAVTKGTALTRFPGYTPYQVGRHVLRDCLHAAEEIINEAPGELEQADDQGGGGLHSTIKVKGKRGRTETRDFGEGYDENVELAKKFAGQKNTAADPQVGEAFVIIATSPHGKMSPYHAAAVVGRDGDDAVTLETWAGKGASLPRAAMYQAGTGGKSFHSHWSKVYFGGTGPVTVVIGQASGTLAMADKPLKKNRNV